MRIPSLLLVGCMLVATGVNLVIVAYTTPSVYHYVLGVMGIIAVIAGFVVAVIGISRKLPEISL
jgi:hypothetical protein